MAVSYWLAQKCEPSWILTWRFPFALDDPRFRAGLDRLVRIGAATDAAKAQGGVVGGIKRLGLAAAAGFTLLRLYVLPARPNALPADIRLAPTW